jgi:hypothetical protein
MSVNPTTFLNPSLNVFANFTSNRGGMEKLASASLDEIFGNDRNYTRLADGSYQTTQNGVTTTLSQAYPGGPITMTVQQGGLTQTMTFDVNQISDDTFSTTVEMAGVSQTVVYSVDQNGQMRVTNADVDGANMTPAQEQAAGEKLMQDLNNAISESSKRRKNAGAGGGGAANSTGSTGGGSAGNIDPYNGGGDSLSLSEGESWFMILAMMMGNVMNEKARELKGLLQDIENAGDEPPFHLTARFNALSQELNFMQSAFMNALNSIGATIKGFLEAGGASR